MSPGNWIPKRLATLAILLLGLTGCVGSEAEFWYNRGVRAHQGLEKISKFSRAIELKPDYADAYYKRGLAYDKKHLLIQAIADYSKAIELNPEFATAYLDRGVAFAKLSKPDQAITDYSKVIELKPDYAIPYYNRGLAYKFKGRYDRALRDYTEAIRLRPDYAIAYINRSNVYIKTGLQGKAIADLNKGITLLELKGGNHNLAIAYRDRGNFHLGMGSYTGAIADLNKANELEPNDHTYGHLAWLYATSPDAVIRNGKRAVDLAERAIELGRDAHNLDILSAAYAEMGRFEEAIDTQIQAIGLLKLIADENSMAKFQRRLKRYRTQKPWRMSVAGNAEAAPLYQRSPAIRKKARQQEEARKQALQQKLEALSGRYLTAGGRSHWKIGFQDNRFEARYLYKGKWGLRYDGTVTGIRIRGRVYHGTGSICRQSTTTPLYGSIDLVRKSFKIYWGDYDLVGMYRHKKCIPTTAQRKWTQRDRQ